MLNDRGQIAKVERGSTLVEPISKGNGQVETYRPIWPGTGTESKSEEYERRRRDAGGVLYIGLTR
jgi:hypothetical protein